jgi:hypothetical protein
LQLIPIPWAFLRICLNAESFPLAADGYDERTAIASNLSEMMLAISL